MIEGGRIWRGMIFLILVLGGMMLAFRMLAASEERALAEYQANPCPTKHAGHSFSDAVLRASETCPPAKPTQSAAKNRPEQ